MRCFDIFKPQSNFVSMAGWFVDFGIRTRVLTRPGVPAYVLGCTVVPSNDGGPLRTEEVDMNRVASERGREARRGSGTLTVTHMGGGFGSRDGAWNGLHSVFL